MDYVITESQREKVREMAFKYLDNISKNWNVDHFTHMEIRITEGEKYVMDYSTNERFFGNEIHNVLKINQNLMDTISGLFTIIDEYDVMDWFNQKYNRDADMAYVDYEDYED